ncbi:MAG: hypothetical protein HYX49_09715 [Chloroflexi bacterium]|nr:hypothetical protein [Chloroflexota bacterium]
MKVNVITRSLAAAAFLSIVLFSRALADGVPMIIIEPAVAAPGAQITVTGTDMEEGEMFKITLEGASGVYELGEATAAPDGSEAGFTVTFTLPLDLPGGSYLLRAATDKGESATADLTIGASSGANTQPMEASAEPLALNRSKSPLLFGSAIVLAILSAGLGVWLVRMRE